MEFLNFDDVNVDRLAANVFDPIQTWLVEMYNFLSFFLIHEANKSCLTLKREIKVLQNISCN